MNVSTINSESHCCIVFNAMNTQLITLCVCVCLGMNFHVTTQSVGLSRCIVSRCIFDICVVVVVVVVVAAACTSLSF